MANITNLLEKFLMPVADKISSNKSLKAISNGFSVLLPITMIGAIFTLLANLQVPIYQNLIKSVHLKEIFSYIPLVTTSMLALYAVVLISKALAEGLGDDGHSTIVAAISLFVFLLLIPLGVSEKQEGAVVVIKSALGLKWLGAPGLFSAMIIALIVPRIYMFIVNKKITIKLPDSVPPTISKSFSALIPAFIVGFLFSVIKYLFTLTAYGSLNDFIYNMLQKPLTSLGASPFTFMIFILMGSLFWFFGLHGGMLVTPFLSLLYTSANLENLQAMATGQPFPNLIVTADWFVFTSIGGAGGTLGLAIVMAFTAKSKQYKTLGKLALPAGLCGINEPLTFGVPIVLNPTILVPFVLTPLFTFIVGYLCTRFGIIPPLNGVDIPTGTPVVFSAWMTGGIRTAILQVGLIIIQVFMYFPFFKVLDKQALALENEIEVKPETV